MKPINIFWFRRDLRLNDNHGLYRALQAGLPVLPVFIFDSLILDRLDAKADPRVTFIYREVSRLKQEAENMGSTLLVYHGIPGEVFSALTEKYHIQHVFANNDYEPYARERDGQLAGLLQGKGIGFHTFRDQVIFEKDEVLKDDGRPYTVFTPYMKRWKAVFDDTASSGWPSEDVTAGFMQHLPAAMPALHEMGFEEADMVFPSPDFDAAVISRYHLNRDFPAREGTSRLGIHLRFGTISIRRLVNLARSTNEIFLNELIWREFYMMILWHYPHVVEASFRPEYDRIAWRNDEHEIYAWMEGNTGYPMVDAGMRQLNATGYMHNRLRMVTASFLVKHLLVDWRIGEAYFASRLLDFELSSNNGGWQWAAGTGCDAAPWFRIFNPELQAKKFDPQSEFIRIWVPEAGTDAYPPPIVDHRFARERALGVFKKHLKN